MKLVHLLGESDDIGAIQELPPLPGQAPRFCAAISSFSLRSRNSTIRSEASATSRDNASATRDIQVTCANLRRCKAHLAGTQMSKKGRIHLIFIAFGRRFGGLLLRLLIHDSRFLRPNALSRRTPRSVAEGYGIDHFGNVAATAIWACASQRREIPSPRWSKVADQDM